MKRRLRCKAGAMPRSRADGRDKRRRKKMTMKKLIAGAAAATILTVGAGAAIAAQQQPQDASGTQAAQQKEQEPSVNGSVAAPAETEANDATEGTGNDAAEARQLQSLAKIDQAAAEKAALDAVPGEVKKTELDNENGSVVYSVQVMDKDGKLQEVKVDAGNGQVLSQEADDNEGPDGD
jgi:uncharacterized membrane protein YkoI